MPQLIVPVNYGMVTYVFQLTGQVRQQTVTIGVKDLTGVPRTPNTGATSLAGLGTASGRPWSPAFIKVGYSLIKTHYALQTEAGFLIGEDTVAVAGTSTGNAAAPNSAVLIHKNTALGGRRNKGRWYVPAGQIDESAVDQLGIISGANVTALQTAYNLFFAAFNTANWEPNLFHLMPDGGVPGDYLPTPITSFTVDPMVATQRRRLRR